MSRASGPDAPFPQAPSRVPRQPGARNPDMRDTKAVFATASLILAILAPAAPIQLEITLNGSPVGESRYEMQAGGAFSSHTTLAIGSVHIDSKLDGHIVADRLTDYVGTANTPAGKVEMNLADGKLHIVANGKTVDVPWKDTTGILAGNLHPQFMTYAIRAADRNLAATPAVKTTTVDAYVLDAGTVAPVQITLLPSRSVTVGGAKRTAKRYRILFGSTTVEYDLDEARQVVAMDVPAQKLRMLEAGWEKLFTDPLAAFPELSQPTFETTTETGVKVKMRDGVELVCDVVRPKDDAKHPAILVRTPYGRGTETINGQFYASRGYVYVTQDCRGREASDGVWDPFVNEGPDGYDTIAWVAAQPWCDGKVGMIGASYAGYVQWAAAVLRPPALKCIVPQVSPPDAMRNIPYDYGIFALYPDLWWAKIVAGKSTDFSTLKSALPNPKGILTLPLTKVDDAVLGKDLPFFDKWLQRPRLKDWAGFDYPYYLQNVKIPALHISGTWDGDEIGTHLNWQGMRSLGRKNQWIIFGPWVHAFNTTRKLGDVDYGPTAIIELDSVYLRWFDTWLKGKTVQQEKQPHVRLFVTGANKWVTLPDWPAPTSPARTLYFAKGALNRSPGKVNSISYTYDPRKDTDVASLEHAGDEAQATTKISAKDLAQPGRILFKSAPMKKATAIFTPMEVTLRFKSSAVDTDFFVQPVDIDAKGTSRVIGSAGKIRASYLNGMNGGLKLHPGAAYAAKITTWDFAHEFAKGHRLGIIVHSSGFPMYARNLGTSDPIATATRMVPQRNTIFMGGPNGSRVTFYVLWER